MRFGDGSISAARRAVRDTGSLLHSLWLGLVQERAGHCPSPDVGAADENGSHIP